jgi:hypothetical protein
LAGKEAATLVSATDHERRARPQLRLAVPAVIGLCALALEIPRFISLVMLDPAANDFRLFYVAAEAGLRWGWSHAYDPGLLRQLSLAFGPADTVIVPGYTYVNPPLLAWIIAPLTVLPLTAAFCIWAAISIAALVAAWMLASPGSGFARVVVLLGSLAIWPTVYSLERGQPVLVTYALAVGCWWMAARRHEVQAGILLALAWAFKPQDVALLPLVLLLCGFRLAVASWLLTSAALWVVFVLVLGATGMGTYLAVLVWAASEPSSSEETLAALFGPGVPILLTQTAIALAALVAVWRQRRTWNLAFAIGLLGSAMFAIHLHTYDFVGVVVAAWLALREPTSAVEFAWLAIGVVCAQLLSIGPRAPMVLWEPVWLLMLSLRGTSMAGMRSRVPFARFWPAGDSAKLPGVARSDGAVAGA